MLTKDAIAHFKGASNLARALGVKPQSIASWGERVPNLRQLQIEKLTGGALKPSADVFDEPRGRVSV